MPPDSEQAAWIREHARLLEEKAAVPPAPSATSKWAKRLAPLGPLAVLLAKFKGLLLILYKLKFLFSFAAFIGLYWALWGPKFGVGFAVMILIHEMGHFIDVKRRGLPAEMPVFLPGLGAYVRWGALGVPLETRAAVSLAGPLAGWFAAAVCALLWFHTHDRIWAALAQVGAWLNILNLIPVPILDGGHAILALSKAERMVIIGASLALWLLFQQELFILVAAGGVWQLLNKEAPPLQSRVLLSAQAGRRRVFDPLFPAIGDLFFCRQNRRKAFRNRSPVHNVSSPGPSTPLTFLPPGHAGRRQHRRVQVLRQAKVSPPPESPWV